MLFFGIGVCVPLLALAYGSREALRRRKLTLARISSTAKPLLGAVLLAIALLVLTGFDKKIEAYVTEAMPDWLVTLITRY